MILCAEITKSSENLSYSVFSDQRNPSVIPQRDNKFVILYQSNLIKYREVYGICMNGRYDYNFSTTSINGLVSLNDNQNHCDPSGDLLSNGNIAVAYLNGNQSYSYLFVIDETGIKVFNDRIFHNNRNQNVRPHIRTLLNDKFLVTWSALDQDGGVGGVGGWGIFAKIYYNDLTVFKDDFLVNTQTVNDQYGSKACLLKNGNFVIAWSSLSQDGYSNYSVYMQFFYEDGDKFGGEIAVKSDSPNHDEQLNTIISLSNGNVVVIWTSDGRDGAGYGVYGRLYSINRDPLYSVFQVNQLWTTNNQLNAQAAALRDGMFVVVWQSDPQNKGRMTDNSGYGVYMQIFDIYGNRIRNNVMINDTTSNHQSEPFVQALLNGTFIITWVSQTYATGSWTDSYGTSQNRSNWQLAFLQGLISFEFKLGMLKGFNS